MQQPSPSWFRGVCRHIGLAWLLVALALLALAADPFIDGDGAARLEDLKRIASLGVPQSKYSSVQPVLALPLYLFGERAVGYFNALVFAAFILAIRALLEQGDERNTVTTMLMTTTMMPHYLQSFFGEILTASACTLGFLLLMKSPRWELGVILLALGTANTPAALPALALASVFFAGRTGRWIVLFAVPAAAALIAGDQLWKYGAIGASPYLSTGERGFTSIMPYSGLPGFSYPFWLGLLSILFSFGKGLVFFIPGLLLRLPSLMQPLGKQQQLLIDTLLVFVLGLVLVYSKWWAWYGGVCWGPRFFIIACVPASLLLANRFASGVSPLPIAVLAWSAWVCAQGQIWGLQSIEACIDNDYALEALCWYAPEFSPLWRQFVVGFPPISFWRGVYSLWCLAALALIIVSAARRSGQEVRLRH